jgi:serpin B
MAVTVSDRLRVRSQPRVADDSVKYEPVLPTGTELLVIEGPVRDSGYDWYRVAPVSLTLSAGATDGWVAAGDHDGTPWIALAEDPLVGLEFARATIGRTEGRTADARRAADSINAFALDLYRRMRTDPTLELDGRNVVFSPTSIALALAMARAGARGETATQMDAVLHADGWKPMAAQLNALEQALAGRNATWTDDEAKAHALSLRIANAAFAQRGWPIEQAYLEAIGEAFGAGLGLLDYAADPEAARKVINAWVSRQTAKRIPELLAPPDISELTRLVLVNAIYLKANWQIEFEKDATTDRAFTRPAGPQVQVPTMSLWGGQDVPYATGAGWKATELRYIGAGGSTPLAMTLVLPDDIDAFEAGLTPAKLATIATRLDRQRERLTELSYTPEDWADMRCGTYPYTVHLFMPRFGVETRADLVPSLKRLGMTLATSGAADFSGITSPSQMFIAAVIHQANIDVDETGTEAAAATAVIGDTTGGCGGPQPAKTITLRLNRPFLFILHDVKTGAILFMGRVLDPSVRS